MQSVAETRPSVEVKLPQVKLRLEDLAFLRSLAQDKSVRCVVSSRVKNRLRFLDLIAQAKIPVNGIAKQDIEKEQRRLIRELNAAVQKQDWDSVSSLGYSLKRLEQRLLPIVDDVLTEKGKSIMAKGEVRVCVRKVGCV